MKQRPFTLPFNRRASPYGVFSKLKRLLGEEDFTIHTQACLDEKTPKEDYEIRMIRGKKTLARIVSGKILTAEEGIPRPSALYIQILDEKDIQPDFLGHFNEELSFQTGRKSLAEFDPDDPASVRDLRALIAAYHDSPESQNYE